MSSEGSFLVKNFLIRMFSGFTSMNHLVACYHENKGTTVDSFGIVSAVKEKSSI
jgi:hypothetical protein